MVIGRPAVDRLRRWVAMAAGEESDYGHVGSTIDPGAWPNRRPTSRSIELGTGSGAFDAAAEGLRRWVAHRGIRATVFPADAPIEVGVTLLVVLPVGPMSMVVANRIVAVVDEPRRFGFAYGTLPGHQERGEESFIVDWHDDDRVVATITVDAVPATTAARALGPLVTGAQRLAVHRYLSSLREFTEVA